MSVGAGSIKRAAKAAEGNTETKAAEGSAEVKTTKAAKGSAEAKTAKKAASSKAVAGKSGTGSKESIAVQSVRTGSGQEKGAAAYITYGIGQELPVYLM